jgi:hypothetical protein
LREPKNPIEKDSTNQDEVAPLCIIFFLFDTVVSVVESKFEKAEDGLRATTSTADPYNLKLRHGWLDQRRHFFSRRVKEDWNRIPAEVKTVDKNESFKAIYRTQRANQMNHAVR